MQNLLIAVVTISLVVHVVIALFCLFRIGRSDRVLDRLISFELLSTLMLAVLVLLAILNQSSLYIDVALGLAALNYIGTIAMSKYVADQKMY
jgi:multisubunit Na+/H+ antiporter MnhF subunit